MLGKVHRTKAYNRYRQMSPNKCDPKSFRTKKVALGKKVVICCPKGEYKRDKCRVGTMAQSILKKR